ncbi:TAXI family TRAP transporter solute-binding subunit [Halegenticoccus tardaugens]|uniref:TAXI family TRAP transporter solute-binding subunit n=1 Tax=Halegenticoccus tardaugens TaxID=2071624 RepID=UPI00100B39BF|nr:TAXI family TRAP transporter solute-binding subunit [Halegenticoccus tardaugens]
MCGKHRQTNRRGFLRAAGATAGLATVAGCLGEGSGGDGGDGGPTDLVMKTASETTAAYAMSQGIAAVVNENSETVRVDARPSEGTNVNVGELEREEIQIAYIQNWTADKLREKKPPFDDFSFQPNQVFHLYDLAWFFCTANDGWESVADIEEKSRVSPTPSGSGTAEMLEHALGYVTESYDRISIDYGEQASAMNEGRLDVGAGTFVNLSVEPGWLQEMKGTVDLRLLDFPDDAVSKMREDPAILITDIETAEFDDYAYAPETLRTPFLAYNFVVRNDLGYDAVYDLLSTMYEHREKLEGNHSLLKGLEDGEFWLENAYEGVPFHPAAADFYEEQGLWKDELTRGNE